MKLDRRSVPVLLILVFAAGCGSEEGTTAGGACDPNSLPGDLVITEVMLNPKSADGGFEWIEIYNASAQTQCLNGLKLSVKGSKTTKDNFVVSTEALEVEPGEFFVVSDGTQSFVTYTFRDQLAIPNSKGTLVLSRGTEELDSFTWGDTDGSIAPEPDEGKSLRLCGECLDTACNDMAEQWSVTSETAYDEVGNAGSPGSANGSCQCQAPQGVTSIRAPQKGDLLFTEIFANPAGTDGDFEWFEVAVAAEDSAIDLSGLGLIKDKGAEPVFRVGENECLVGIPGAHVVFARSADTAVNGGVGVDYAYGSKLTLKNTDAYLAISYDGEIIAEVTWKDAPEGKSLQADPDDTSVWCESRVPFGSGSFGTPGEPNYSCSVVPCMFEGNAVDALSPRAGDLTISEIMANTPGAEEAAAEWIELVVSGTGPIDLNGIELWKADAEKAAHVIQPPDNECLRFQPGDTILLARSALESDNGIAPDKVDYVYTSLTLNAEDTLSLRFGSTTVDEVTYDASEDGRSVQQDPASGEWCTSSLNWWDTPAGDKGYGSPGEANSPCGQSFCVEGSEQRPVRQLNAGSVVVTEVFANPKGADSSDKEWLELLVRPEAEGGDINSLDLRINGKSYGHLLPTGSPCLPATQGLLLLSGAASAELNGGLAGSPLVPETWDGLPNATGKVQVYSGTNLIDEASWTDAPEGIALQLDSSKATSEENDDVNAWCEAQSAFNPLGDKGTPGQTNLACGAIYCTTGGGESGQITAPTGTPLVITEVFANTKGAEDVQKEWFEVFVTSASSFHINGSHISTSANGTISFKFTLQQCIELTPQKYYVFCRNPDSATNGGLPPCISYGSVALEASNATLGLWFGASFLDVVPDLGTAVDGVSRSLDPDYLTGEANDDPSHWCNTPSTSVFGDAVGTPGQANPQCL